MPSNKKPAAPEAHRPWKFVASMMGLPSETIDRRRRMVMLHASLGRPVFGPFGSGDNLAFVQENFPGQFSVFTLSQWGITQGGSLPTLQDKTKVAKFIAEHFPGRWTERARKSKRTIVDISSVPLTEDALDGALTDMAHHDSTVAKVPEGKAGDVEVGARGGCFRVGKGGSKAYLARDSAACVAARKASVH